MFGRQLRDFLPVMIGKFILGGRWLLTQEKQEVALAFHHKRMGEGMNRTMRELAPLNVGMVVPMQNQWGPQAQKWDQSGMVVDVLVHSQNKIKLDGSGRVSLSNWVFYAGSSPILPPLRLSMTGDD